MGFVVLAGLTFLAAAAGMAVAARLYGGRSERALAAFLVWLAILVAPIHALGWVNRLSAGWLGATTAALSLVVLGAALAGFDPRHHFRQYLIAWRQTALLPIQAFREAWQERSFVLVGLAGVSVVLGWTFVVTYLAPSGSWDGLTYHEPIIYYAVQNRGFEIVNVPEDAALQQINSAPKFGHYLSIWCVIFTDRTLVELPSSVLAIGLLLGGYALFRLHTNRVDAIGYACCLLLFPAIALQMRSTYQDGLFACVFAMAAYFVVKPGLRQRDIWMAAFGLALVGGVKFTGLLIVPIFALIVLVRSAWTAWRERRWTWGLAWLGALSIVVASMAPTYVRNWRVYDNPVWPRNMQLNSLGLHFEGPYEAYNKHNTKPVKEVLQLVTAPPEVGKQFPDTRDNGYGNGPPFLLLPLAAVGLLFLIGRVALIPLARPVSSNTRSLAWLVFGSFLPLPYSPSIHWARYTVYALPGVLALAVWLIGRPKWVSFSRAVLGALLAMGFVTLWWSEPGWAAPVKEVWSILWKSPAERATVRLTGNFNMDPALAARRDTELSRGDVVAYTHGVFIASFWNEAISNRVVLVPWPRKQSDFVRSVDAVNAKWVVIPPNSVAEKALLAADPPWVRVGKPFNKGGALTVYARGRVEPKPAPAPPTSASAPPSAASR